MKLDPAPAVAVNVTTTLLSEIVMLGEHVLVTVWEATAVPVPPHVVGALTVPEAGVIVTDPVPPPAKMRSNWRASVNVVCAV